jgi:hypothetical protein
MALVGAATVNKRSKGAAAEGDDAADCAHAPPANNITATHTKQNIRAEKPHKNKKQRMRPSAFQ